jgi:hypothetical protein
VVEEGLSVHSLCCKALRDADMALGGSATAAERFQAALPVLQVGRRTQTLRAPRVFEFQIQGLGFRLRGLRM